MEFSRQEYWSGMPFPSPRYLPDPGIEPGGPALQAETLLSEPPGKQKKFQARTLEWGTFPFPKGPSQPRDRTRSGALQVDSLLAEPQGKPMITGVGSLFLLHGIFPTQESNQCLRVAGRFFTN